MEVAGPALFSETTGAVGMVLSQIPNQPTTFIVSILVRFFKNVNFSGTQFNSLFIKADPSQRARTEDAIIAWTWMTFLENPDNATILLRLPMTKAAVRAMVNSSKSRLFKIKNN